MAFAFTDFQTNDITPAFVDWLVDEQWVDMQTHFGRLWDYYQNPMYSTRGLSAADAKLNDSARVYIQAQEMGLPARITGIKRTQASGLLGGEPIEKIDVQILLDLYKDNIKEYKRIISEKEKTVTILKKNELDYESTIAALEQQLEREKARTSLWQRIKNLGISFVVLMIIAVIALLIFAPNVLGWIVAKIPSLVSLLGVASFRVVGNIVKGVQKAREEIAQMPDDKKLNKTDILNLIDCRLKEESDRETANTVETIRKKYNLRSVTKKLGNKMLTSK